MYSVEGIRASPEETTDQSGGEKTMSKLKVQWVLAALLALAVVPGAQAASITVDTVSGSWSNTVGGLGVVENVAGPGGYNDVRWGVDGPVGQSGLGFLGAAPASFPVFIGTDFLVGNLQHYNRPINAAASSTDLSIAMQLTIDAILVNAGAFNFRFAIDETPNTAPCAYPSATPCADRISFTNLAVTDSFNIGGILYTVILTGFSTDGGVTISPDFISDEGADNVIGLYGRIVATSDIPEPSTLALFGLGLAAMGLMRKRIASK